MVLTPGSLKFTPPRGEDFEKATAIFFIEACPNDEWIVAIPAGEDEAGAVLAPTIKGHSEAVAILRTELPKGLLDDPSRNCVRFEFEEREGDGLDPMQLARLVPREALPPPAPPPVSDATVQALQDRIRLLEASRQPLSLGARDPPAAPQTAHAALQGPAGADVAGQTRGGQSGGDEGVNAVLARLAAMQGDMTEIRKGQVRADARLTALERSDPLRPEVDSGTFGLDPASASAEDRALMAELRGLRPAEVGADPPRALGGRATFPRRDSLHSADAEEAEGAAPADPILTLASALKTAFGKPQQAKATGPLGTMPEAKLFTMEGAKGRLAQDLLEQQLKDHPEQVVADFEAAVRREAPPEDPSERDISLGQLQRCWRQTVPSKEHALAVRMAEALLHIYPHLRGGRQTQALARLALVLGALEQGIRDNGNFSKRADTIMCMPPPPLPLYHAHSTEERQQLKEDKKGLGGLARLVGAARATTARAVYLENAGTTGA
jgi:hypothetical protein